MQSKSKNDGVQLSTRYWTYTVAKRHLRGTGGGQVFPITGSSSENSRIIKEIDTGHQGNTVYGSEGLSTTLNSYGGGQGGKTGIYDVGDTRIRRLTPIECERLQGFPDNWCDYGLTEILSYGNIEYNHRGYVCEKNVELKNVIEKLYVEKQESALCTIKDLKNEGQQTGINIQKRNVPCVGMMQLQEVGVQDIINLGKSTVTLCDQTGTKKNAEEIKKNLTQEKTEKNSILPLWKIHLEEKFNEERLSTILTWIRKTIKNPIFTYIGTEEPITKVIIHWNSSLSNYSNKDLYDLKMVNITPISDTQRYKCLGNAVTTNVITAIGEKLLKVVK